jgi:hypothetical protein
MQEMAENGLAAIVGSENILESPEVLEQYSRDTSFVPGIRPRCVVRPASFEEVQGVVKWANETNTPLIPVSSGPVHSRGDTVPGVDGVVIVDLGRMNKIIRTDPVNRVALVEPGVTFGELQAELNRAGLQAYLPLLPRVTKSVMGSVLEREPITMPSQHWDSTDPMLCIEVIFGTGDRLRTGEAAGPDTLEEQWKIGKAQISPFGPTQMDVQRLISGAQGTMGIVTWVSVKCRVLPKLNLSFLVPSKDVEPLIELSYMLLRPRMGETLFIVNNVNLACLLGRDPTKIEELRKILPPWVMFVNFEGHGPLPEEKVRYQEADLKEMAGSFGLTTETAIPGATAEELYKLVCAPSPEPYWKTTLRGGFQDIFFLTTLDQTPGFTTVMTDLTPEHGHPPEDMGMYIQPIVQGTSCHCEFNLYYSPEKRAEVDRTRQLVTAAAEDLEKRGAFFSRPYAAWKDVAYRDQMSTYMMQKKVKEIFDPNGILNPGKLSF